MSFVQIGFLVACAAGAVPVLVHLLSRWQVRNLELGTARFLQEIIREGAQRRRIRRWLLLLTRVALVILLALLFARPFLPERARGDGGLLRIVLLDRSASMGMPGQQGRLVDDAVRAAADAVAEIVQAESGGWSPNILWAWFDHHVEPLDTVTARPSAPGVVVGDTNYLGALEWARDRLNAHPDAAADVVLVTDLQQSGLTAEKIALDALDFPRDVPVRIIDVGRPAANNLAITSVAAPASQLQSRQACVVSVTLFNYGTLPFEEVHLAASAFNGERTVRLRNSVSLPGGQAEEVILDFGPLDPAIWQITVALDVDDDLAADNRRQTAVRVAESVRVLVLDSGSREEGVTAESYYLAAAIEQSGGQLRSDGVATSELGSDDGALGGRFRADVAFLGEQAVPVFHPQSSPLVIVPNAAGMSLRIIQQLEDYVRQGGRLIVFAGDPPGGDAGTAENASRLWQQGMLAPGELGTPERSGAMPFRITSLSDRDAMLRPFADPQHGDLTRLRFLKFQPVDAGDSTEVLARFDEGRPALTRHHVGSGSVLWFLSSADGSWSDWTMSPLYLPLVQQMAGDLLNLTGEGPIRFRSLGDRQPQLAATPQQGAEVRRAAFPAKTEPAREANFTQPGFVRHDDVLYVINGREKESDPTRIEPAAFAQHFDLTLADEVGAPEDESIETHRRNELWPWLAAAALVVCVGEFTLANRTLA